VGGQLSTLVRVLKGFVKTYRGGVPELSLPADPAAIPRWQAASHSLRGACATLGASDLSRSLHDFEVALDHPHDLTALAAMAAQAQTKLKQLVGDLDRELALV
jgi:two-component system sensor histidine kinase/response regulator